MVRLADSVTYSIVLHQFSQCAAGELRSSVGGDLLRDTELHAEGVEPLSCRLQLSFLYTGPVAESVHHDSVLLTCVVAVVEADELERVLWSDWRGRWQSTERRF